MIYPTIIHITKRLRQISRALDRNSKFIQEKYHITIPQLICIWEIYQNGPITLGRLTENVSLNKSTVTGIVDRLEKRGMVRRTRVSKDRRQIHVEITDEGTDFIKKAPSPLHERFSMQIKQLESGEVEELLRAIDKIVIMMGPEAERME